MLNGIRAYFTCDRCDQTFTVQLDPPYVPPEGWTMYDVAEDAVRGSSGYGGPLSKSGVEGCSSIWQKTGKWRHLCGRCTSVLDKSL